MGDGDPVDVVEIGSAKLSSGCVQCVGVIVSVPERQVSTRSLVLTSVPSSVSCPTLHYGVAVSTERQVSREAGEA